MNLLRFGVSNYKSLANVKIDLQGRHDLSLFVGKNNSGKSNLFDAVLFYAQCFQQMPSNFDEIVTRYDPSLSITLKATFVPTQNERTAFVNGLFTGIVGARPELALTSNLLKEMHFSYVIAKGTVTEELSISNNEPSQPPCVLVRVKYPQGRIQWEAVDLQRLQHYNLGQSHLDHLNGGDIGGGAGSSIIERLQIGDGIKLIYMDLRQRATSLRWINPIRRSEDRQQISGSGATITLAPDAANLAGVLHILANNQPDTFAAIQNAVPVLSG